MSQPAPGRATHDVDYASHAKPAGPCVMVIFGATGDLTARKLVPALYNLLNTKLLSDEFAIVGVGRDQQTEESFRKSILQKLQSFATADVTDEQRDWLISRVFYVP